MGKNSRKKQIIVGAAILISLLAGSGIILHNSTRDHHSEVGENSKEQSSKSQTVVLTAYVDVSKSNKSQLYFLEQESLQGAPLLMSKNFFEKLKGLNYPLVKLSQTFIEGHLEKEELVILEKENKEVPRFLENQDKALRQISTRLNSDTEKINSELNQLLSQAVEVMTFNTESKEINVKLNPLFTKENEVGQKVILDTISGYLEQIYENKVLGTIWEKEYLPYPISYTVLNTMVADGDFFGHITKKDL